MPATNHHHHEAPATVPPAEAHEHAQHDAHAHHEMTPGAAHDRHAGHSVAMFRDKFLVSLLLTVPTLIWSDMVSDWLGFTPPDFPGARWLPAVFGTAVFFYGGLVFLQGAVRELRD